MTLEDLLKAKRISQEMYEMYVLFQANELGRKCLERMTHESFMDEPQDKEFRDVGFAFYDGRRSVFRDIHRALTLVKDEIRKSENDGADGRNQSGAN